MEITSLTVDIRSSGSDDFRFGLAVDFGDIGFDFVVFRRK